MTFRRCLTENLQVELVRLSSVLHPLLPYHCQILPFSFLNFPSLFYLWLHFQFESQLHSLIFVLLTETLKESSVNIWLPSVSLVSFVVFFLSWDFCELCSSTLVLFSWLSCVSIPAWLWVWTICSNYLPLLSLFFLDFGCFLTKLLSNFFFYLFYFGAPWI